MNVDKGGGHGEIGDKAEGGSSRVGLAGDDSA